MPTLPFHGRVLTLAGTLTLTVGDWKALVAAGVTHERIQAALTTPVRDPEAFAAFALAVLRKADRAVTAEEVEALTVAEVIELLAAAMPAVPEAAVDRPTSTPATSSAGSTAGAPQTSPA